MSIKIEKSKSQFIKVSINSEELNLSINIMNCNFNEIEKNILGTLILRNTRISF